MLVSDIDTPALIVDLDVMEQNIQRVQSYCTEHGIRLRVHVKTHKVPAITHKQLEAGAVGILCQKLGEAEVMVAAGIRDIMIAYNIVGDHKLERLARLASQAKVGVIIDSEQVARGISDIAKKEGREIDLLIELYTGRTGASTPQEVLKLARLIHLMSNVTFKGLMIYPSAPEFTPLIRSAVKALKDVNIPVSLVCGGKSLYAFKTHEIESSINELHLGTYVFYDFNYVASGVVPLECCAASILTTVVSRPKEEIAIVDAGSKAFSWSYPQSHPEFEKRFGYIKEYPEGIIYTLAEEHGFVNISKCSKPPSIGEKLTVIPNSINDTVNMHNQMFAIRKGKVEAIWLIAARGCMQ